MYLIAITNPKIVPYFRDKILNIKVRLGRVNKDKDSFNTILVDVKYSRKFEYFRITFFIFHGLPLFVLIKYNFS